MQKNKSNTASTQPARAATRCPHNARAETRCPHKACRSRNGSSASTRGEVLCQPGILRDVKTLRKLSQLKSTRRCDEFQKCYSEERKLNGVDEPARG